MWNEHPRAPLDMPHAELGGRLRVPAPADRDSHSCSLNPDEIALNDLSRACGVSLLGGRTECSARSKQRIPGSLRCVLAHGNERAAC